MTGFTKNRILMFGFPQPQSNIKCFFQQLCVEDDDEERHFIFGNHSLCSFTSANRSPNTTGLIYKLGHVMISTAMFDEWLTNKTYEHLLATTEKSCKRGLLSEITIRHSNKEKNVCI